MPASRSRRRVLAWAAASRDYSKLPGMYARHQRLFDIPSSVEPAER